jgi:hypothetical protein
MEMPGKRLQHRMRVASGVHRPGQPRSDSLVLAALVVLVNGSLLWKQSGKDETCGATVKECSLVV